MTGHKLRMTAAIATLALGAAFAFGAAQAQTYSYADSGPDYVTTSEGVTVFAPGGRAYNFSREGRVVSLGDPNLDSPRDAHVARTRIERAARDVCQDLAARHPATEANSGPECFRMAVQTTMFKIENQIGHAPAYWPWVG